MVGRGGRGVVRRVPTTPIVGVSCCSWASSLSPLSSTMCTNVAKLNNRKDGGDRCVTQHVTLHYQTCYTVKMAVPP